MDDGPRKAGRPAISNSPHRIRERARYAKLRKARRCGWCSRPTDAALCTVCGDVATTARQALRQRRRDALQCEECGAPTGGQHRCDTCAEIRNLRPSRQPGGSGW